jgi:hypothetical protein
MVVPELPQRGRIGLFDLNPKCAQRIYRVHTIFAGKKPIQGAYSIRQGGDNYRAMRDTFIARYGNLDVNSRCPFYSQLHR